MKDSHIFPHYLNLFIMSKESRQHPEFKFLLLDFEDNALLKEKK